ncbi:non-canonical purine NTP diphosphatase [Muricauda ruestringensis]|uniref:dITP/XTP pyrophosphatase n=1 Tax=Flagellimonas marinaquae TaxID=254955 RepID=A0AA48KMJ8_9FLAO|nr:non-canonical purine NTP diphosphatase [Allomuricauda ruestringensis]MCA0959333.1 non-canonical purine NTP diphosphatase [Allomuricauda ruestringensis]BDW91205.1 non-canonical purine NTP pyrophosphatase [Allomuricauda aquimarina]
MKLVFATHNDHKLKEVQQLLPKNIQLLSLKDIDCFDEIPETGDTLEENAKIKADHITQTYGLNCFSDDTGLLVDALNGAPGVYSARYAGEQKDASDNMQKLLNELNGKNNRKAHFKTVVHLNLNGEVHAFEGTVDGVITDKEQGKEGFGYDPIFKPNGFDKTFGELPSDVKNSISHRGRAIRKLVEFLKKNAT